MTASPNPLYISARGGQHHCPGHGLHLDHGQRSHDFIGEHGLTTGTNVSWLSATIANGSVSPGSPGSITVTANSSGLTSGVTYQGTVTRHSVVRFAVEHHGELLGGHRQRHRQLVGEPQHGLI